MIVNHDVVQTERLALRVFTTALIDAFAADDRALAERAAGATFPIPFAPPPETGDVLPFFRAMIVADDTGGLFLPRLIINREESTVVGSIGVNAPNEAGIALTGYSVYPLFEGNGYASEAARALVDHVLDNSTVQTIQATIEVSNRASQIVASRAGLTRTPAVLEVDGLTLEVWERRRSQS